MTAASARQRSGWIESLEFRQPRVTVSLLTLAGQIEINKKHVHVGMWDT